MNKTVRLFLTFASNFKATLRQGEHKMKRLYSLLLVSAMILAMICATVLPSSAATGTLTIHRANSYDVSTETLVWASTNSSATVESILGTQSGTYTFTYWYGVLLEYSSTSGAYEVSATSGFDANGNSTRPDETYASWNLGQNKLVVLIYSHPADEDASGNSVSKNFVLSLRTGDSLYLTGSNYSTLANASGTLSGVSLTTTAPSTGDSSSEDSSDESTVLEPKFDIELGGDTAYTAGGELEVTATVKNITATDGISALKFEFNYDPTQLSLKNDILESDDCALDCITSVPSNQWDNLTGVAYTMDGDNAVADNDGVISVSLATARLSPDNFAANDGDIVLTFKFDVADNASGNVNISVRDGSIAGGTNTDSGIDKFTGNASTLSLLQSAFAVELDAPATYRAGEAVTVTATVSGIANPLSLIKFNIAYDASKLAITNNIVESDDCALDCVTAVPSSNWDNLSSVAYTTDGTTATATNDGNISIALATASTDTADFATENGDIVLTFTFTALADAEGEIVIATDGDVIGAVNTSASFDKYVGVGSKVSMSKDDSPAVMLGDLNDDEEIDTLDYTILKRAVVGTYTLNANQAIAGDIDRNDSIDTIDYTLLKRAVIGSYTIVQ